MAIDQLRDRVLAATGDVSFYKSGTEYIVVQRKRHTRTNDIDIEDIEP